MHNKKRLVLMSCCAPCSAGAIRQLANSMDDISEFIVLFYNPNIFPETEYQKRLAEQIRYCNELGVKYHVGAWDHNAWRDMVKGLESAPERGARCAVCFRHRFLFGINWAYNNGYDAIASVFGVSRHKDQAQVDAACLDAIRESGHSIEYIPVGWDEQLRETINRESDFYRQKYCGCEFSC